MSWLVMLLLLIACRMPLSRALIHYCETHWGTRLLVNDARTLSALATSQSHATHTKCNTATLYNRLKSHGAAAWRDQREGLEGLWAMGAAAHGRPRAAGRVSAAGRGEGASQQATASDRTASETAADAA